MLQEIYPLTFVSLQEPQPWGGVGNSLLQEQYPHKNTNATNVGNYWHIVDDGTRQSVVDSGSLAGRTLRQLVEEDPVTLVGSRHQAHQPFPLQLRLAGTAQPLPLSVYPLKPPGVSDTGTNTQMWYILAAEADASVSVGIQQRYTQQQFLSRIDSSNLGELVQEFPAEPGDAYFVIPGRIHALGAGVLALIVQCNDTMPLTIREADGSLPDPPLDRQTILESIDFQNRTVSRIRGESSDITLNRKVPLITHCTEFIVDEIRLIEDMHDRADGTTFHLLTPLDQPVSISCANGAICDVEPGRTALIPAGLGYYSIRPSAPPARLLRTVLN